MSEKFKIGDSVVVKPGVADPDNGQDIGGWQGRVVSLGTYQEKKLVTIQWDSITLENMPEEVIEQCEEAGTNWAEIVLGIDEVQPAKARDTEKQVKEVEGKLRDQSGWLWLGPEGKTIRKVLEGVDPDDDFEAFEAWYKHLSANLKLPFEAEIDEWQDRGPHRPGDKLTVLAFEEEVEDLYGVMVDVKGKRGMFVFPLCDLAAVDKKSDNYDLIEEYRVWFANR
ncbi:MAG: hypothetical protein JXB30_06830 [Anaerolineae bacterium]|nr:hypothetical protein [Anaerolineae bacterium]